MPETNKRPFTLPTNQPKPKSAKPADGDTLPAPKAADTPAKKGKPKGAPLPVRTPEEAQVEQLCHRAESAIREAFLQARRSVLLLVHLPEAEGNKGRPVVTLRADLPEPERYAVMFVSNAEVFDREDVGTLEEAEAIAGTWAARDTYRPVAERRRIEVYGLDERGKMLPIQRLEREEP